MNFFPIEFLYSYNVSYILSGAMFVQHGIFDHLAVGLKAYHKSVPMAGKILYSSLPDRTLQKHI